MRRLLQILLSIFAGIIVTLAIWWSLPPKFKATEDQTERTRLARLAEGQKSFLTSHGLSTSVCFLVDMGLPSGKNRFFIYNFQKDSVISAGLVSHGSGNSKFAATPAFSNLDGSNCTSLGRYRVGGHYVGRFGRAYKLFGLDSTNSNAFARNVVLHSYAFVPSREIWPVPICNSRGCPMVAPVFLKTLQPIIDSSRRPLCLYIFK